MSGNVRLVARRFHLVGPLAGKSIVLNGVPFRDGVHEFRGPSDHADNLAVYLERTYNAHPEGEALDAAHAHYEKLLEEQNAASRPADDTRANVPVRKSQGTAVDQRANGGAETGSTGHPSTAQDGPSTAPKVIEQEFIEKGAEPPALGASEKLMAALKHLDPENDEHWTQMGLPALATLGEFTGMAGIKRADVEAAAPGFTREIALAAKEAR